ncbi:MAG: 30S ribosomal protein S20 [Gammaproteobacteria bacterium]|nr:30S ribosomal protein S20 [Gammaproteobacteria bacterium]
MANTPQARKRARQAETRRLHNAGQRSAMRTAIKKVLSALKAGDADNAKAAFDAAIPVIDGAAGKGLIHKNKAARHKSRLNSKVKALAAA